MAAVLQYFFDSHTYALGHVFAFGTIQIRDAFCLERLLEILRYCLVGLGVVLVVAGARHYSMLQFLGIQQIRKESARSAMTGSGDFDDRGVLGLVRHPWYVAVFIFLWTSDLNITAITANLVLSAYLIVELSSRNANW